MTNVMMLLEVTHSLVAKNKVRSSEVEEASVGFDLAVLMGSFA